jgi:hypothetical protein
MHSHKEALILSRWDTQVEENGALCTHVDTGSYLGPKCCLSGVRGYEGLCVLDHGVVLI